MSELILLSKFLNLCGGIAYGYSNTAKVIHGRPISGWQVSFMSLGWAGFITLQWLI